jgi:nudix-type nucleoside diphosphatase (YffH/AdpP family)
MTNENIRIIEKKLLSDNKYLLNKIIFDQKDKSGNWHRAEREIYDRGNGAAILLYNKQKKTIILTRQFRMPTYVNNNPTGMLIEVCAGLLDNMNPEECIKKETEEETGFIVTQVQKVLQAYMSPGSMTEILHFFVAEYSDTSKKNEGGGLKEEGEDIEVIELNFNTAMEWISTGEIKDAKTIMLLYHAKINNLV